MAVYEYSALDAKGKRVKGIIDAESTMSARHRLRATDIFPVEIREVLSRTAEKSSSGRSIRPFFKRVSLGDISLMTRQLSTLIGAGIPLVPSLTAIASQVSNAPLQKIVAQVKEEVNEGKGLAESLQRYAKIFPSFYVNMVRAGEASGALDVVLERLAAFSERQQALQGRIRAALAYPLFMFAIGAFVLFFLTTFIVPRITTIFTEMHQTLPGITVFLITVSEFLKSYWWILLLVIIGTLLPLRYLFRRTVAGGYIRDRIKITVPVIGTLLQKIAVARFARTMGTLLTSGVPMLSSLSIAKNIVNNRLFADAIEEAAHTVEQGQSLSSSLDRSEYFPPLVIQMISVGEQSGTLEDMLFKISDSYEMEVESRVTMMTSLLEPVMILIMGLVVGFIVVSILLPIFEMNQLIR